MARAAVASYQGSGDGDPDVLPRQAGPPGPGQRRQQSPCQGLLVPEAGQVLVEGLSQAGWQLQLPAFAGDVGRFGAATRGQCQQAADQERLRRPLAGGRALRDHRGHGSGGLTPAAPCRRGDGCIGGGDAGFLRRDEQPVNVVGESLRVPVFTGVQVDGQAGIADRGQHVTAGPHGHLQARLACQGDQEAAEQGGGGGGLVDGVDDHDPAAVFRRGVKILQQRGGGAGLPAQRAGDRTRGLVGVQAACVDRGDGCAGGEQAGGALDEGTGVGGTQQVRTPEPVGQQHRQGQQG